MKKDKTSMSSAVLHMLKIQIKAEANQLRQIRQPTFTARTPTQKRHFQQQQMQTMPTEVLTPSSSKKHFFGLTFTESPSIAHKQRKHYEHQYRHQLTLNDCEPVERLHPMVRTSKAGQTRIQIDLSEQKPKKENLKSPLERTMDRKAAFEKFFRRRPRAT